MKSFFCFLGGILLVACSSSNQIGRAYRGWHEGEMDLHHIYTGRGESNFMIFPDGTSMLVDAGDYDPKDYPLMTVALPNSRRRAGEWIARYIERVNPMKNHVDYMMISHFHSDHMGDSINAAPYTKGRIPNYVLTGIAEVAEYVDFSEAIDRGYPNYNYPYPIHDRDFNNYINFIKWKARNGLKCEQFVVGSRKQIRLKYKAQKYDFHIENLASNGEVLLGNERVRCYDMNPKNTDGTLSPNENTNSIAIKVCYGPFAYYTGGDLSGRLYDASNRLFELDSLVALTCGKVDVCKANHHAYRDAMSAGFIADIRARNYIIPVWDYAHIQPAVLSRMDSRLLYPGDRNIFPTELPEKLATKYANESWMKDVCKYGGHVVVKVYDKGKKYLVYVLSAKDESMIVRAVYGPFKSNSNR